MRLDPRRNLPYARGFWRHLLGMQPAEAFLCWDKPVYSVFDGRVVSVGEGWPDRARVNLIAAHLSARFRGPRVRDGDVRPLAGNFVIVEGAPASAFYAHLKTGSAAVEPGQSIRAGDVIGRVGNSGNSTMPHLHFHLMDRPNILEAAGVPCHFRSFERREGEHWVSVEAGMPGPLERVRWPERA